MSGREIGADAARELLDGTSPGPWCVWESNARVFSGTPKKNNPGTISCVETVAEVDNWRHSKHDPDPSEGECGCERHSCEECYPTVHADAKLIAAAPDLAATVIAQAAEVERLTGVIGDAAASLDGEHMVTCARWVSVHAQCDCVIGRVRAALAKAVQS